MPRMLERLAYNTFVTDQLGDLMRRATAPQDIEQAKREGRFCFYFTTNGVPLPGECVDARLELRQIEQFFMLGVRMMHLTYNRRNVIGDGCAEPQDAGLSDFGRDVVREMNRVGVIVDGAHSSLQTCRDMAKVSSRPVVVSHASCRALNEHVRGKSDDVIKAVADSGGYTGMACIPAFLGRSGDIAAFLDHIEHAVKLVGAQHVAIGTDVSISPPEPEGESFSPSPSRRHFESHWPDNDALFDKQWSQPRMTQSLEWTNFPMFTVGLVQRGLSDEQILAILGGNVLRVAKAALAH
jgi:membrane dipeptidase